MNRVQLNLKMPATLVAELRVEAQQQGITLTALVERRLAGGYPAASSGEKAGYQTASPELASRLDDLEQRLARLELERKPRTPTAMAQSVPTAQGQVKSITRMGDAITTAELAEQTGTNRGGWNNWAGRAAPGEVRQHPTAGSWRLVGKAPAAGGGPDRWLWEQVTAAAQQ